MPLTVGHPALSPLEERVVEVLAPLFAQEGVDLDATSVAHAICSVATPAAPLSAAERSFLDAHSGIPSPGEPREALLRAVMSDAQPDEESTRLLSTQEVAALLGQSKPSVTRARERGDLFAVDSGGRLWFPAWQFADGQATPGLRDALATLPSGWGLRRPARFMATDDEALGGLSPLTWLRQRSAPDRVAELMAAESRE